MLTPPSATSHCHRTFVLSSYRSRVWRHKWTTLAKRLFSEMLTTTSMFGCFHFNCRGNKTNALEDILEKSSESEENDISEEENLGRGIASKSGVMKNNIKIYSFSLRHRYISINKLDGLFFYWHYFYHQKTLFNQWLNVFLIWHCLLYVSSAKVYQ